MTEPTTPTGKAVAAKYPVGEHWLDGIKSGLVLTSGHEIAAIEAEARQQERERLLAVGDPDVWMPEDCRCLVCAALLKEPQP